MTKDRDGCDGRDMRDVRDTPMGCVTYVTVASDRLMTVTGVTPCDILPAKLLKCLKSSLSRARKQGGWLQIRDRPPLYPRPLARVDFSARGVNFPPGGGAGKANRA